MRNGRLLVHGQLFAFRDGESLVVALPEDRAADLKQREVAFSYEAAKRPAGEWVCVTDRQLWPELAREAHDFVGEPATGGES